MLLVGRVGTSGSIVTDRQEGTLPSGTRSVSGISGTVDLNEFKGTLADLKEAYKKETVKDVEQVKE
ncbi:hypothetical protein D3C77_666930 [compost metagenome]